MTGQEVYLYMSKESAARLEALVTDAAEKFFAENDMNKSELLEEWAKYDRLKVDIAIARARADARQKG